MNNMNLFYSPLSKELNDRKENYKKIYNKYETKINPNLSFNGSKFLDLEDKRNEELMKPYKENSKINKIIDENISKDMIDYNNKRYKLRDEITKNSFNERLVQNSKNNYYSGFSYNKPSTHEIYKKTYPIFFKELLKKGSNLHKDDYDDLFEFEDELTSSDEEC